VANYVIVEAESIQATNVLVFLFLVRKTTEKYFREEAERFHKP